MVVCEVGCKAKVILNRIAPCCHLSDWSADSWLWSLIVWTCFIYHSWNCMWQMTQKTSHSILSTLLLLTLGTLSLLKNRKLVWLLTIYSLQHFLIMKSWLLKCVWHCNSTKCVHECKKYKYYLLYFWHCYIYSYRFHNCQTINILQSYN